MLRNPHAYLPPKDKEKYKNKDRQRQRQRQRPDKGKDRDNEEELTSNERHKSNPMEDVTKSMCAFLHLHFLPTLIGDSMHICNQGPS